MPLKGITEKGIQAGIFKPGAICGAKNKVNLKPKITRMAKKKSENIFTKPLLIFCAVRGSFFTK
jgi:hypothetical protein